MNLSVHLFLMPAPAPQTAQDLRALRGQWVHLEAKDQEVKKETAVRLVQQDRGVKWVCPVRWAHQDHRAQAGVPSQAKLVVRVQREIRVILAYLDRKVHRDRPVTSDPLDPLVYGDPQERRARWDPEALKDPWDLREPLE